MHEHEQMLRFGGGGETYVTPFAVVLVLVAIGLICGLPRKYVFFPLLFATFLIPMDQAVVIGGLHFTILRVLIVVGWARVLAAGWQKTYRPSPLDQAIVIWGISAGITFVLLWGEWGAFINRLGFMYSAFGIYFLFRVLFQSTTDIDQAVIVFATICALLAVVMVNEKLTGRNVFSVFGGVSEFTPVREGSLRAQGPFQHPILAGTFGAVLLPLFIGLWWGQKKRKSIALLGIISALVMVVASSSSTPIMAAMAGILGVCLWPLREWMRVLRWSIVIVLTSLHIVMKAPVWALMARVDVVNGSSGYHRYELVNQFILHFSDWWLVGEKYTSSWGYFMHDVSNQYVAQGTEGGLITFALFLWVIVRCFKVLGRARKSPLTNSEAKKRLWSLGSALVACLAAFFGTTFFDQTTVAWYALLAMIATSAILPRQVTQAEPQKDFARVTEILPSYDNLVTRWSRQ